MKILYFDTETTGLTENSAIIQIAGIIEENREVLKEFNIFSQPHEGAEISDDALAVHGISLEKIQTFQTPGQAHSELKKIFDTYIDKFDKNDKFIVAGYNVDFDIKKLTTFFLKNNDGFLGSYIFWKGLDPFNLILPLQMLKKIPRLKNNKLATWCEHYGIEINSHDALSDIKATKHLIDVFMCLIEN